MLKSGKYPEVKIMPSTASLKARERLGDLGFNVTLKEVGKGEKAKAMYHAKAEKHGKMLGLFKIKGEIIAEVDSETGEINKIKKPWWAFLVSGI